MYIEEIILQGFKTYVNRTVISGFDPQFNAITGFNGSGKSNVLDAIQFLLGSTNKEMLRLKANFTQVIYKQGCSGIEKASVSIKFRCADKNMRPTGYQNNQQLLVTRQITKDKVTKFFVNGLSSNLGKVKSLFRSVHLNIQNPHFLVKQGQITKIINLKPQELLGMIEETAGTAIYNKTRTQSEKMIDKKEIKMKSINQILRDSIMPQMEKLKTDRKRYTAFKDRQALMKQMNQEIKIYQFLTKRELIQEKDIQMTRMRQLLETNKQTLQRKNERLAQIQGQVKILRNKGSNAIFNDFTQITTKLQAKKSEQKQLRKRLQKIQNDCIQIKQQAYSHEQQMQRKKQDLQWKSKQLIQQQKNQQQIQSLLRQVNASKGSQDAAKILQKQVYQQKQQIRQLQIQIKTMKSKIQVIQRQENIEKRSRQQLEQTSASLTETLKQLHKQITQMEKIEPPKSVEDPELTNNYLQSLQGEKKRMINQHFQLRFSYNDPTPNFDRTKVKGKLFTLFSVKQKIHQKALEIGAGGKLGNIVVQNQIVSKLVIEKQCFGKNVSVIPNNKIRFKQLRHQLVNEARRIGKQQGGLARPAYELIQFDQSISNSIMFAFSGFIVCSSPDIAKRIAYHQRSQFSCKCVTYDGDIFERGTLTGGHMNANSLIIGIYSQFRAIQQKIAIQRKRFESERNIYSSYLQKNNEYKKNIRQIESKQNRIQKIKQRINDISFNYKKRNFAQQIQAIQSRIQILSSQLTQRHQKYKSLSTKNSKGGQLKSISEQKSQLQKQLKKQDQKVNQIKKQTSILQVQINNLLSKSQSTKESDQTSQQQIAKIQQLLIKNGEQISIIQRQHQKIEEQKRSMQRQQAISQSKLQYLYNQDNVLKSEIRKAENQLTKLDKDIKESQQTVQKTAIELKQIIADCSWLDSDKQYEVDKQFNYQQSLRQYRIVIADVDKLRKTAKMTIDDHSYQKLQQQYASLLDKRKILEQDKITLLNNMNDLDDKRMKTLEHCYKIVKQNLSKIFNDLLPGATAHLNLLDQTDVTKGAQLQVQFNKIRKDLSQLSGGQRSLLALSFILALLLYKPSPFYILDEIDSALDLSHTQNIGYMISQRFPQSQFIIISLKQGMFQNANVLYKVHFAQGQSKVDRQMLKKK